MKKNLKRILITLGLVIIVGISIISFMRSLPVETVTISPLSAELYFIESGFVKTGEDIEIYPFVSGELLSVNVTEGQIIKPGDIICSVYPSQYEHELKQAESTVSGYKAQAENLNLEEKRQKDSQRYNLKSLKRELDALIAQEESTGISRDAQIRLQNIIIKQGQTQLKFAEDERMRGEVLFQHGAISESEYNKLKLAVQTAELALESQKSQLEIIKSGQGQSTPEYFEAMKASLKAQIEGIESSLNKTYIGALMNYYYSLMEASNGTIDRINEKIEQSNITSRVDGRVVSILAKNSNTVSPSIPVAVINNETEKLIEVFVSTKDIDSISVNDEVEIIAKREHDFTFSGIIKKIDAAATVKLSALGVEERKVKVTVKPEAVTEITLNSNYDVDVKFITYKEENQFTVPKTAVYEDTETNQDMVFVIEKGKAVARKVVRGTQLRTDYIIESGLNEGDIVIKDANTEGLSNNTRVKAS